MNCRACLPFHVLCLLFLCTTLRKPAGAACFHFFLPKFIKSSHPTLKCWKLPAPKLFACRVKAVALAFPGCCVCSHNHKCPLQEEVKPLRHCSWSRLSYTWKPFFPAAACEMAAALSSEKSFCSCFIFHAYFCSIMSDWGQEAMCQAFRSPFQELEVVAARYWGIWVRGLLALHLGRAQRRGWRRNQVPPWAQQGAAVRNRVCWRWFDSWFCWSGSEGIFFSRASYAIWALQAL